MIKFGRYSFGNISGSEVLDKALRARRERKDAIAFYAATIKGKQTISALANYDVTTSMRITRGYLFRLLIVANSPDFVHELIMNNIVAPDTVVDIHFYLKKRLKRKYTDEELNDVYMELLEVMTYYKKSRIFPLLAEKYFQVGRCFDSSKYADIAEIVEI